MSFKIVIANFYFPLQIKKKHFLVICSVKTVEGFCWEILNLHPTLPSSYQPLSLPIMLINEDALSLPALLLAVHDTCPVSCSCIPSTISELERVSTKNRPDVFTSRSFRNHNTSGVGNPRTGHTRRTISPSTTRKSWPILTTASSIPSRPITRPVDVSIRGFSPAMIKIRVIKIEWSGLHIILTSLNRTLKSLLLASN